MSMNNGFVFEEFMAEIIFLHCCDIFPEDVEFQCEDMSGTIDDTHNGTDAIIQGVRVDWATSLVHKDFYRQVRAESYDGWIVTFGIRTGNCHGRFPQPVVVVALDYSPRQVARYMGAIKRALRAHVADIYNAIMDVGNMS